MKDQSFGKILPIPVSNGEIISETSLNYQMLHSIIYSTHIMQSIMHLPDCLNIKYKYFIIIK